jgi:predicted amidohydrolase YtcJ
MHTTLLRGGVIVSPSAGALTKASAMLVRDGRIAWLGTDDAASSHVDATDEIVDLDGALVTPAFVDSHVHLSQTGLSLTGIDLSGARSRTEMLDLLADRAGRDRTSSVLLGFSWDDSRWVEPGPPSAAEIDRAVGDRPVYASRVDGHSAVLSSALIARAPGLADAEGWDGTGRVERAAHHVARDSAHALIDTNQRRAALRRALDHAASLGIGCVHEISAPHINPPEDIATIRELAAESPTITVVPYWGELHAVDRARELGCQGAAGDLCMDGSLGSRTAALTTPYADADTCGHRYLSPDEVRDHVVACTDAGLQAGFHAIGDAGVTAAVDGLTMAAETLGTEAVRAARHRIEHLEMVSAEQADELARLGVMASVQPAFDAAWGGPDGMYAERLGVDRAVAMNPYATLAAAGVRLAFGSDSPVTPLDPWGGVRAAVEHRTPAQRLTLDAALDAHTAGGWHAARRDDTGRLVVGAPATYAVWTAMFDANGSLGLEPPPTCRRTVVHGTTVYDAVG